jgi:hypothetical protein
MSIDSGLRATLAVALPLLAAAPFVAAAAYVVVRQLRASTRGRATRAGGGPERVNYDPADPSRTAAASFVPAVWPCGGAAESFDVMGAAPLGTVARREQDELLTREQAFEKLRRTGEGAPARVLDLSDTGIRIGDGASMLRFGLEVLPSGRPAFRAETQCAVADGSRVRLAPGSTVNVRFGIYGSPLVAVDYAS